eukprot:g19576.t1
MSPERLAAIERERRKIAWHEKRMEKLKNEETLLLEAREYLRAAVRKVNAGPQQAQGAEQQASPPVTVISDPTDAGGGAFILYDCVAHFLHGAAGWRLQF